MPYTGIKILGAKNPNTLTSEYLVNMIKVSQNHNKLDDIIIKYIVFQNTMDITMSDIY